MRKHILPTILLAALSLLILQCSPQAEESTGDKTTEEQFAQALFYQLGLVNTEGLYWVGTGAINSCIGSTLEASPYCGTLISKGEQIQQENVEKNVHLTLTDVQGSALTAKLYLIAPHFNAIPSGYEFAMSGTKSNISNYQNSGITLAQTSVLVNNNTGYNINFKTEFIDEKQIGSLTAVLSTGSVNGDAILTYNIELLRGL